jgi:hypothetical protein
MTQMVGRVGSIDVVKIMDRENDRTWVPKGRIEARRKIHFRSNSADQQRQHDGLQWME